MLSLVAAHDAADPADVAAHAGINSGVSIHDAVSRNGHDSLQLAVTHQRSANIYLQTKIGNTR